MENSNSLMRIGNDITKAAADSTADRIISLFKSASELRISDKVLKHAIDALVSVTEINNVTVSGCSFVNNPKAEESTPEAE